MRFTELHPGGHGVHFHLILNRFVHIQAIRRWAAKAGFGRVHVVPRNLPEKALKYVVKDMNRIARQGLFRQKLWLCWRRKVDWHCKIKRIAVIDPVTPIYKSLCAEAKHIYKLREKAYRLTLWHIAEIKYVMQNA